MCSSYATAFLCDVLIFVIIRQCLNVSAKYIYYILKMYNFLKCKVKVQQHCEFCSDNIP